VDQSRRPARVYAAGDRGRRHDPDDTDADDPRPDDSDAGTDAECSGPGAATGAATATATDAGAKKAIPATGDRLPSAGNYAPAGNYAANPATAGSWLRPTRAAARTRAGFPALEAPDHQSGFAVLPRGYPVVDSDTRRGRRLAVSDADRIG
jgi:hypothetical protein